MRVRFGILDYTSAKTARASIPFSAPPRDFVLAPYTLVYTSRISGLSQILCCPGSRRISRGPASTRRPSNVATRSSQSLSEHLIFFRPSNNTEITSSSTYRVSENLWTNSTAKRIDMGRIWTGYERGPFTGVTRVQDWLQCLPIGINSCSGRIEIRRSSCRRANQADESPAGCRIRTWVTLNTGTLNGGLRRWNLCYEWVLWSDTTSAARRFFRHIYPIVVIYIYIDTTVSPLLATIIS